jgi:hypothetical protein
LYQQKETDMNTITFDLKLNVGDTCYVISDGKIKKCIVERIFVEYETTAYNGSSLCKTYALKHADGTSMPNNGRFDESEIWATKEELIKHIEEL